MLRLFYFSGTGNARAVARWVVDCWRERGRPAEMRDLARTAASDLEVGPDDEIGLASPTHGFNFPPITLAFLFAFPRTTHRNPVFIVNTRAGMRFCGLHLPGLSGVAQLLAALVFGLKGYRVVGMRPVDLPSNWISVHPGPRERNVAAIFARCERITRRFAHRLLDGRRDLRALFDLPQDLLIAPIAVLYYLVGRFFFAKSFFASGACDRCGACVEGCPVQAIRLVDGRPFWSHRCESCMHCMNHCPKRAIETAHGFVAAFLLVLDLALLPLVDPALRSVAPALTGVGATVLRSAVETVLMLAALFPAYRLVHLGLRVRLVERLAVMTSLTHFAFWRRYRAPVTAGGTGHGRETVAVHPVPRPREVGEQGPSGRRREG